MAEILRVVLVAVMLAGGVAMVGYAGRRPPQTAWSSGPVTRDDPPLRCSGGPSSWCQQQPVLHSSVVQPSQHSSFMAGHLPSVA